MGLLSKAKNFLIEDSEMNYENYFLDNSSETVTDCDCSTPIVMNIEDTDFSNIIQDVYEQNNISDFSKSIYKVKEIIETLPVTMSDATKKETVMRICRSFGLEVDELLEDASIRCTVLTEVASKVEEENNNAINTNNAEIENCKKIIEELEKKNKELNDEINITKSKIAEENSNLLKLSEFIGNEVSK